MTAGGALPQVEHVLLSARCVEGEKGQSGSDAPIKQGQLGSSRPPAEALGGGPPPPPRFCHNLIIMKFS